MAYRRGHCTGEKREKQGSQDWYQHYYEEHLARIEAAHVHAWNDQEYCSICGADGRA